MFDEILFTELSGDLARELLAKYIKEGQVKFPPGSRRFRREDRRIGKDGRYTSITLVLFNDLCVCFKLD